MLTGATLGEAQAGSVPGRDLLSYPIGLAGEAGALPGMLGMGLYNPAASVLDDTTRLRLAAASMSTPGDVGASAQLVGASGRWRDLTVTASLARAGVSGLVRTESDPLTVEASIAYYTLVTSLSAARRVSPHLVVGAALRLHTGRIDAQRGARGAIDAGFVADHLTPLDLRVAGSSFLLSPGAGRDETPTWLAAADARVRRLGATGDVRLGVSAAETAGRPSEQFAFAALRYSAWEVRGGPVRTSAYGDRNVRARLAVAVHHRGYAVGLARETSPAALGPSYQFVLRSELR